VGIVLIATEQAGVAVTRVNEVQCVMLNQTLLKDQMKVTLHLGP
jgi:hypothetical protein